MTKEKLIERIRAKIEDTEKEYKRQCDLWDRDERYSRPDADWRYTRIRAFNEVLELVGMLDNSHNR